jgi:hypothetical protein
MANWAEADINAPYRVDLRELLILGGVFPPE